MAIVASDFLLDPDFFAIVKDKVEIFKVSYLVNIF